jgi:Ca2+-binding RTX toxin-like protein
MFSGTRRVLESDSNHQRQDITVNRISSLRRVVLGAAVAGAAFGVVPALASASPCTYDPVHKVATVVDASGVKQVRVGVSGNLIFTQDGGNPAANCAGATTTNTDRINVFAAAKGASDGVVLDQAKGAFAPGATPEADGNSEIEIALNGQSGHLSVFGTPGNDVMRVRQGSRAPANNVLDFGPDDDDDVTFAASDVALVGGDGADILSGRGFGFEGVPAPLPLVFSGGAGDDVISGGAAVDHFSGNAGNDTLNTTDGNPELVSGGPDIDKAVRDGADTLINVESSVFGSAGAALGAMPALSSAALPKTCLKDGVCFTKQLIGSNMHLTVTGTPGDDTIVVGHLDATTNNTGSGNIGVNGKRVPGVFEGARLTIAINALAGNDHVSEPFPATTQPLYGTSTVDGGEGDDVLAAAFRDDVVIGGPGADILDGGLGNDQLLARDGQRDVLHGGLGTDAAQADPTDASDGVESVDAQAQVAR